MLPNIEISHNFYIYSYALFLTILSQLQFKFENVIFSLTFAKTATQAVQFEIWQQIYGKKSSHLQVSNL